MTILFLNHQIRHQATHKWAVSLVTAHGHLNLPQGFVWVCTCMGSHTHFINPEGYHGRMHITSASAQSMHCLINTDKHSDTLNSLTAYFFDISAILSGVYDGALVGTGHIVYTMVLDLFLPGSITNKMITTSIKSPIRTDHNTDLISVNKYVHYWKVLQAIMMLLVEGSGHQAPQFMNIIHVRNNGMQI